MDELRKEEINRAQESLDGYNKELELQKRKYKALSENKELVKNNMRKIKPEFAYEELDAYWTAQAELYDIRVEEDLFKTNKMITTLKETIPDIESSLKRLKGDEE